MSNELKLLKKLAARKFWLLETDIANAAYYAINQIEQKDKQLGLMHEEIKELKKLRDEAEATLKSVAIDVMDRCQGIIDDMEKVIE